MPLREKDLINFSKQAQAEKERKERLDNALEVERVIDKILKGSDADDSSYADEEHRRVTKWGREATNARAAHTRARRASPMRQRSATNQQPSQSSTARSVPSRTAHPIPQVHPPASPLRRQRSATRQSNQHAAAAAACTPSSSGHLPQQQHSHTTRGAPSSSRPLPSSQAASSPVRRQRSATRQSSTQSHKAHPHPHVVSSLGEKTAPPTSARASSARGAAHNQHQAVSHHPPHSAASALACSHQDAPPTSARRSQRHQGHASQVQQLCSSPVRPSSSTHAHAHPPSHAHAPKDLNVNNISPANSTNNNSTVPSAAAAPAPAPALTTSATTMTTVLSSAGNAPRSASTSITTRNIHASGTPTTRATNGTIPTAPTHIGAPMRSPRIDACAATHNNTHNGVTTMQHAATTISSPRSGGSHHGVNEAHQTASRTVQHAANNQSSSMNEARLVPANGGNNHLISATGPSGTHCQRAGVMGAMGANTPSNVPTTNVPIKKRQRVQPQSIIRTRQQRKLDAEELNVSNNMAMNDDIPNAPPLPLGKP